MGFLQALREFRANYPGGWRRYARGSQSDRTPPFTRPGNPTDPRSLVPPLGLKEYWYPALPARDVGWKKPVALKMLGEDLVFFRDKQGEVQALWDYCPHRGIYLSLGDCFWKGFLSCPYHGATYDGNGECVAFITEGPDSKMPGRLRAKKFPTRTLRGVVFVWMGQNESVPVEDDLPPELFDTHAVTRFAFTYWDCNWMISLENIFDPHGNFLVHRNSWWWLKNRLGGTPRTPVGYRTKLINYTTVAVLPGAGEYYAQNGKIPYQMYYPGVDGYWPLHRWRLLWAWFFTLLDARRRRRPRFETPEDWEGVRLPCIVRLNVLNCFYTRWIVPVDENVTRLMYICSTRPPNPLGRLYNAVTWPIHNWEHHFNFSNQDFDAQYSVRYQHPEYLSATDSVLIAIRKLITEHARGIKRPSAPAAASRVTVAALDVELPTGRSIGDSGPEKAANDAVKLRGP